MEKRITKRAVSKGRGERRESRDLFPHEIRKRFCRFCQDKVDTIDYKDITRLSKFLTERKKIVSRRLSGVCARHQRKVSHAMKRARFLALM